NNVVCHRASHPAGAIWQRIPRLPKRLGREVAVGKSDGETLSHERSYCRSCAEDATTVLRLIDGGRIFSSAASSPWSLPQRVTTPARPRTASSCSSAYGASPQGSAHLRRSRSGLALSTSVIVHRKPSETLPRGLHRALSWGAGPLG